MSFKRLSRNGFQETKIPPLKSWVFKLKKKLQKIYERHNNDNKEKSIQRPWNAWVVLMRVRFLLWWSEFESYSFTVLMLFEKEKNKLIEARVGIY